jgi:hypothetical protein
MSATRRRWIYIDTSAKQPRSHAALGQRCYIDVRADVGRYQIIAGPGMAAPKGALHLGDSQQELASILVKSPCLAG